MLKHIEQCNKHVNFNTLFVVAAEFDKNALPSLLSQNPVSQGTEFAPGASLVENDQVVSGCERPSVFVLHGLA